MIISRTPFRVSFFGGGTDYPVWYEKNGGAVLSATIDKYCYITTRFLPQFFNFKYRIRYTTREEVRDISEIAHPSVRECLKFLNINNGVEMIHTGDLPAQSGTGSSSAFTVGFLNSLYALSGRMATKRQLALDAIHVEQDLIRENVGSQDQTSAAFGGFNKIEFGGERKIFVQPITIGPEKINMLQSHLMLFFTGFSRTASDIAREQIKQTPSKEKELTIMKQMVDEAVNILNGNRISDFGRLLDESWKIKRGLTDRISNSQIDNIYDAGIRAGALGGKLCGAGGGGFILFFAPPENQSRIKEALNGFLSVPFHFESLGSQIIFHNVQDMSIA
ncbi:MAG: kinase [Candidatus Nealsonbacteria bacterium RIFCSPHIGHO2_01_FULL_38_55]|uniref:Kinase n=2 Tax=Candidatus Nealsoniibacteriota TaxID=1817911 RepID=A0A1G2EI30_9BACT|nr:MAG: GHMP kinase [Parcubacteria group bacterium GW2011_GWA2_38_27]KKQ98469.1 MAG: GHMP kinase [Parcubacteria group bacterium GW2011_GWC2_39_11]OGZ19939.1 MAG: kinase [Candidatus Nealsonbacteria bacterium RIFCSPHIGHO2_01_FULL_38_55]OGZ20572.1 MAG: kinase [Candidatus Nealsonbacteria bacterium RIFCSPHIGHO2_02_38_10]OGZ22002.1 MAG: kinase [Candidatus Nealsonbacteria bacterium RIFCSPHIGHO2_02_FULL_38_75]OGZ23082.1 MAG: kinase [Candidatus Nealsonbacteria bacterium RIFCSPLOWO2_01_FULL_38_120]OGZ2